MLYWSSRALESQIRCYGMSKSALRQKRTFAPTDKLSVVSLSVTDWIAFGHFFISSPTDSFFQYFLISQRLHFSSFLFSQPTIPPDTDNVFIGLEIDAVPWVTKAAAVTNIAAAPIRAFLGAILITAPSRGA